MGAPTAGTTATPDGRVAWTLVGPPPDEGGVPVVALHGVTDSGACWAPVAGHWATGRTVVAVDARGHGRTPLPADGALSIAALARDAAAVVREVVGRPVVAVGHSMGGLVAEELALTEPGLVAALVLEDPAWARSRDLDARGVPAWLPGAIASNAGATRAELEARSRRDHPTWLDDEHGPWAASQLELDPRLADGPHGWDERDWVAALAAVRVPVLLVTGDPARGALVDEGLVAAARAALGDRLTHAAAEGAGHSVRREAREAFLRAVDGLLRGVDAAAGRPGPALRRAREEPGGAARRRAGSGAGPGALAPSNGQDRPYLHTPEVTMSLADTARQAPEGPPERRDGGQAGTSAGQSPIYDELVAELGDPRSA